MTDTTKRYRLLKDIDSPELKAKAGDIGKLGAANKVWFDNGRYFFCKDTVESTSRKEWFEVLSEPVKEMVGVTVTEMNTYNSRVHYGYSFNVHSVDIDCGKIKQAIESALNDTVDLEMYKLVRDNEALKSLNEQLCSHIDSLNKKIQTPLKHGTHKNIKK